MGSVDTPHKRRRTSAFAFVAHEDANNSETSTNSSGANASADATSIAFQPEGFEVVNSEGVADASITVIMYEGFEVVLSDRCFDAVPEEVEAMRS